MTITIQPIENGGALRITGDVDMVLTDPGKPREVQNQEQKIYLGLSDGSLVSTYFGNKPDYVVVIEGAGLVSKVDEQTLRIEWQIEWICVSGLANVTAVAQKSVHALPLFQRQVRQEAA